MILQFSLNMLVPICLMSALGYYLDRKFGTSFVIIIFFFAGAAAGGRNIYKMAMADVEKPDRPDKESKTKHEKDI
ncbi:MAG: AtpZ/AtpI family protein [Lachnospiraceae bacterium]|nr:AtpZ/AtpI family protein [Lachnospiraceae bacterium]